MDDWIIKNVELVKVIQLSFIAFIISIHIAIFVLVVMYSRTEWIWNEWIWNKTDVRIEELGTLIGCDNQGKENFE
jgi:hypothetical protein